MTTSAVSSQNLSSLQQMQNMPTPPKRPSVSDMVNNMAQDLGLSDDQKKQLTSILQKNMDKMNSDMNNQSSSSSTDTSTTKTTMDQNMKDLNDQIKSILTTDQANKFQSLIDNMKNNQPMAMQNQNQSQSFQSILDEKNNALSSQTTSVLNVYS